MIERDYDNVANKPTKYIVAGNYNEYQAYVKKKPRDKVYYKYVSGVDTIRGLSEIDGCYIGSYASRKDIEDIKVHIAIIKSKRTVDEIVPAKYEWKDPGVGIVAQEVGQALPEAFVKAMNGGDIEKYIKERVDSWVDDDIVYKKNWDSIIKDWNENA